MSDVNKEIKILGAGPAGLSAAINLAKSNFKVSVFEHQEKSGAHFHNGWQILENYTSKTDALDELKIMGIAPDFFYLPRSDIDFYDSRLRKYPLSGKKTFGYFLKRGPDSDSLDTALYNQAVDAGVNVHFNTKISLKEADIISGGSVHATGIAKEIVFETDAEDTFITILDNYLTPLGFSYLFIINGNGTLGTAVMKNFKNIHEFAENVLLRFQQIGKFSVKNERFSVSSIGFFVPRTAMDNGKWYVGEAAGFQDYLFGLGIRKSIQSGYLAAKSIISGLNYDVLWRKQFSAQFSSGILSRFLFELGGNVGYTNLLRFSRHFDFQKSGYFLNNPSFLRKIPSSILKLTWGKKKNCKHGDRCSWCRSR